MVYIGHFSFIRNSEKVDDRVNNNSFHGCFTLVAEAESVESALEKFRDQILNLNNEEDIFYGVNEVFLDACIECKTIPDSGFLAYFVEWTGLADGSLSTTIRGATEEQVNAYSLGTETIDDDSVSFEEEPFLVLNE